MFGDIGWAELLLIGIVALIVIGPEDLPHMFRQLGRFTAKMRAMSRDFSRAMEQASKDSGVKDVTDSLKGATSATSLGLSKVKAAADRFEKWDPIKAATAPPAAKPTVSSEPPASVENAARPVSADAAVEPKIYGAATQALIDKQAVKKAILAQTAEKLRAVDAGSETAMAVQPASIRKPKAAKSVAPVADLPPAAKPRTARKAKKADDA